MPRLRRGLNILIRSTIETLIGNPADYPGSHDNPHYNNTRTQALASPAPHANNVGNPAMSSRSFAKRLADELGISTLLVSSRDVHLLLLTRCIRMFAYGASTLVRLCISQRLNIPTPRLARS